VFLQSFARPRRKADVVTLCGTIRDYNVNVKHAAGTVRPDFALSSETPGGYVGQTSPLRVPQPSGSSEVWPARRSLPELQATGRREYLAWAKSKNARLRPFARLYTRGLAEFGLPDEASRSFRRRGEVWRRGESNPCFLRLRPLKSSKGFVREDSERLSSHGNAWMALDVISFVIGWPGFGDTIRVKMLVLAVQSGHGPIERLEAKATTREAGADPPRSSLTVQRSLGQLLSVRQ
jgi:hypothetical protein